MVHRDAQEIPGRRLAQLMKGDIKVVTWRTDLVEDGTFEEYAKEFDATTWAQFFIKYVAHCFCTDESVTSEVLNGAILVDLREMMERKDFGFIVPLRRIVKLVPPDLEMLDSTDRAAERQHALTERHDVPVARAIAILQEDIVLEHRSVPTDPGT